jgi:hypothetical protein
MIVAARFFDTEFCYPLDRFATPECAKVNELYQERLTLPSSRYSRHIFRDYPDSPGIESPTYRSRLRR